MFHLLRTVLPRRTSSFGRLHHPNSFRLSQQEHAIWNSQLRALVNEQAVKPDIKATKRKYRKRSKETTTESKIDGINEVTPGDAPKVIEAQNTGLGFNNKFKYTKHGKIAIKSYKSLLSDLQMGRKTLPAVYVEPTEEEVSKKVNKRLELVNKRTDRVMGQLARLEAHHGRNEIKLSLLSYINLCVDAGLTEYAQGAFKFYNRKFQKLDLSSAGASVLGDKKDMDKVMLKETGKPLNGPVIDISHYNALLRGLAVHKSITNTEDLFATMKYHHVTPNHESFGWYILSIYRSHTGTGSDGTKRRAVKNVFEKMRSLGLDPADLFVNPFCKSSDKELIITTIKLAYPDYAANRPKYSSEYYGNLLKDLESSPRKEYKPLHNVFKEENLSNELERLYQHQMKTETEGYALIPSVAKAGQKTDHIDSKSNEHLSDRGKLAKEWITLIDSYRKQLLDAFNNAHHALATQFDKHKVINIIPILSLLKPDDFVDAMIETIEHAASSPEYSPPLTAMHMQIAERCMKTYSHRYKDSLYGKELDVIYREYLHYLAEPSLSKKYSAREWIQHVMTEKDINLPLNDFHMESRQWPFVLLSSLGRFLCELLMRECKIPSHLTSHKSFQSKCQHPQSSTWETNQENELPPTSDLLALDATLEQSALYTSYIQMGKTMKIKEELHANTTLAKLYQAYAEYFIKFDTSQLPMVSPPMPWLSPRVGGYLRTGVDFVRQVESASQQVRKVKNVPEPNLLANLDSLTALSVCPWKINKPVLDCMIKVFQEGGNEDLDIPLNSSTMDRQLPKVAQDVDSSDKSAVYRAKLKFKQNKKEMFSLWCDCLYRLSIANHYRDKVFWFPHNFDFRGRVYPVPPHFNHLGNDLARGMLVFAKGSPLGPDGLKWLKIHLVNLTGHLKKSSLTERVEYAEQHMNDILDSADNPFDGKRWWTTSEDPWQALAACMEVANAIRSPDPSEYICHFPVHQDGSCNGLQHYAALGRDSEGAKSVNLMPSKRPQDVYTAVCDIVERERIKDAESGNTVAQLLEGYIKRKTIKQTVMTTVYGVTRYGARAQIYRQLKDLGFPDRYLWKGATYVMQKTFFSYSEIFNAARQIQDWFVDCATAIADKTVQPVQWTTPLGFLVIQPYHKEKRIQIYNLPGNPLSWIQRSCMSAKPNLLKQRNAFPPNFIHSLDSTHMMMTSLACERAGVTFVSVHDCYWTHPSEVSIMNRLTRDAFVTLHSSPILEDLSASMIERASKILDMTNASEETRAEVVAVLSAVPPKGTFNLNTVRNSTYFFS